MSHNIYRDETGKDCMFVVGDRSSAWHQLGQRCDNAANWEQAVTLAGLDYEIVKQQNYARLPGKTREESKPIAVDSFTIFNGKTGAQLGTVGPDYTVKQNADCFRFIDTLLEANGGSHYDSAGALGNGARIWCAVRVPKADFSVVKGDDHETYLIFMTAHDGSLAHTTLLSGTRVVCQNTFQAALSSAQAMFKVKHTRSADVRLERAKELMTGVVQNAETLRDKFRKLAGMKMTRKTMVEVLNKLFPAPKEENANTTRRENVLTQVLELYGSNDKGAVPEIAGTAYNLFNAVTEYTDHFRSARITDNRLGMSQVQARAENAVSGTGDKLKSTALAVIEQVMDENVNTHTPFDAKGWIDNLDSDNEFARQLGVKL